MTTTLTTRLRELRDNVRNARGQVDISERLTEFSTAIRDNFDTIIRLLEAVENVERSLADIESFGNKTLINDPDEPPEVRKAYSEGAHNAFAQVAEHATATLATLRAAREGAR